MTPMLPRALVALAGLTFAGTVAGQPGGFGDQSEDDSDDGTLIQRFRETTIEGTWTLEFEVAFDSREVETDSDSRRSDDDEENVTLRADVTTFGTQVTGRFRNPANGEFSCTLLEGSPRCEQGRLLVAWPGENQRRSAEFEFVVDSIDRKRARGEARMFYNGSVVMYTVRMAKR